MDLFDFTSFLGLNFFKFSGPLCFTNQLLMRPVLDIFEDCMFHILENCNRKKIEKLEGRSTLNLWSCQQAYSRWTIQFVFDKVI